VMCADMILVQPVVPLQTGKASARSEESRKWRKVSLSSGFSNEIGVQIFICHDHSSEVFVSDNGCNLFTLDLRNGGILCGYKGTLHSSFFMIDCSPTDTQGLSGAVTSIAPSPTFVTSTALDRFARIHSTSIPPQQVGQQVEKKGEVIDKVYTKSIPTVVIWDGDVANTGLNLDSGNEAENDSEDENVWDRLENVGDSDGEDAQRNAKRSPKKGRVE
jgi:ribosome biogenesis protein NSA1